jgi:hypothetical protein
LSASFLNGPHTGSTFGTASWASTAILATSINFVPNSSTTATSSTQATSASWASSSISSSYSLTSSYAVNAAAQVQFTRGGVFYDADGIAGTAALSQSMIIWRAPFNCTASAFNSYRVTGSGATVNAKKNGSLILSSSFSVANTDTWNNLTTLQNNTFVIGDKLELTLMTASGYPTQVAIQLDMQRF